MKSTEFVTRSDQESNPEGSEGEKNAANEKETVVDAKQAKKLAEKEKKKKGETSEAEELELDKSSKFHKDRKGYVDIQSMYCNSARVYFDRSVLVFILPKPRSWRAFGRCIFIVSSSFSFGQNPASGGLWRVYFDRFVLVFLPPKPRFWRAFRGLKLINHHQLPSCTGLLKNITDVEGNSIRTIQETLLNDQFKWHEVLAPMVLRVVNAFDFTEADLHRTPKPEDLKRIVEDLQNANSNLSVLKVRILGCRSFPFYSHISIFISG